jgi:hypothetical protein
MSKLGSIITSALPVATMLIVNVRAYVLVCVCGFCSVRRLNFTHYVLLRLSPVSLALLLQGFPRKCAPNAQCDDVVNSVREIGIDCKLIVSSRLPPRVRINNRGISPPKRGGVGAG